MGKSGMGHPHGSQVGTSSRGDLVTRSCSAANAGNSSAHAPPPTSRRESATHAVAPANATAATRVAPDVDVVVNNDGTVRESGDTRAASSLKVLVRLLRLPAMCRLRLQKLCACYVPAMCQLCARLLVVLAAHTLTRTLRLQSYVPAMCPLCAAMCQLCAVFAATGITSS